MSPGPDRGGGPERVRRSYDSSLRRRRTDTITFVTAELGNRYFADVVAAAEDAAHARGFVASWITGWACYDAGVNAALCQSGERIAGFFYIGTASQPLEERPRPELATIVRNFP